MPRLLVPVLAALALFAAGCGGNGNGGDETLSTTEWVNEFCGAIGDWGASLQSATEPLGGGNLSREALQDAADDVESSTREFTDELEGLGAPDIEAGQEAKDLLDGLDEELDDDLREIQTAVDGATASNILATVSTVSDTLGAMAQQIASTFEELGRLDAADELEEAFEDAENCDEVREGQR
jgi:hypothetical protein